MGSIREKRGSRLSRMSFHGERGPFLDPFLSVNPCCCCCGAVSITNGIKTVSYVSMVVSACYLVMGCWFAFTALMVGDEPVITPVTPAKSPTEAIEEDVTSQSENLMNILLICSITNITGGAIRFLSSLFLLKSAEKETKTPAKVWCVMTFSLIIIVTAVVLAASQKHSEVFHSLSMDVFLCLAGIDFLLLLYFLWLLFGGVACALLLSFIIYGGRVGAFTPSLTRLRYGEERDGREDESE